MLADALRQLVVARAATRATRKLLGDIFDREREGHIPPEEGRTQSVLQHGWNKLLVKLAEVPHLAGPCRLLDVAGPGPVALDVPLGIEGCAQQRQYGYQLFKNVITSFQRFEYSVAVQLARSFSLLA